MATLQLLGDSQKSLADIEIGTKVRYETDGGTELDLIAIQHEKTKYFDFWICVNPNCSSKTGKCALHSCFTEDLEIGWK